MSQADSTYKAEVGTVLGAEGKLTMPQGRYADEDKAYVWYKRLELKADLEARHGTRCSNNAIWAYPTTAFSKWLLFDKIGLYATEPRARSILSQASFIRCSACLYLVLPLVADTYIDTGWR